MTDLQKELEEKDDNETEETEGERVKFSGKIKKAFGEVLDKEVPYTAYYTPVTEYSKIPEDEFPSKKDILNSVNAARKLNERAKATAAALKAAGIEKPDQNDPLVVQAKMLKDIEKLNIPEDQKAMMRAVLGAK